MIDIINVHKNYGSIEAVKGLSFSLERGEIYGLLGPNGAGKSTTIRMIMNIIQPSSGEILFDGRKILESDKDRIGYMPEERGLYKKVAVDELLVFLAELKGMPARNSMKLIDFYLKRFGLFEWKKNMTDDLSKGMSQKIQFISTILHNPDIIILDEPFSGLDPVSADQMSAIIAELRDGGKTIIFSTHIMDHAEKICNRICILKEGKAKTDGTVSEVKSRHGRNTVVIDFEGTASFIRDLAFVEELIEWPGSCEVSLVNEPEVEQKLLKAVVEKLKISRFEVQRPSLHKIFIDLAGEGESRNE
ncbi:MAG: ATP-binding cassette domain-containing protein [Spirochaetales bacterium]|uniref:ATP-binding cassette domain-containing protein n=1 Tax=Candidatus Thalassospirochaeta sargassi TaxID=3119039 RepID=A0AAJ1IER4_9SPIO|nr:ATP-binding cassette domain-containing protein [Spirochaetales bacterium]